jgi:zinc transporter ZupT
MNPTDTIVTVLAYASIAAFAAALGPLPQAFLGRLPVRAIGWANALASGLMLGVAYAMLTLGQADGIVPAGAGALLGIGFVILTHSATGTTELDLNRLDDTRPEYGYQVILVNTMHAAHEGIAIGAAMHVSLPFGISMALALAVHNIPEAMVLSAILNSRGVRLHHMAGLTVAANLNQVLLAVVTFALLRAVPLLLPWIVGFSVGGLIYLVLVELLPESYRQAGRTSIALVAIVAMVVVVLLTGSGS